MSKLKSILVWDLPTRLWHWFTAAAIFYAWFSIEFLENMDHHFWAGYTALCLILFRLIWGLVGGTPSRFSEFFRAISNLRGYNATLLQRDSTSYLGHNPMGAIAALLMMLCIAIQVVTGLFNTDDYFFGPLSGLVDTELRNLLGRIHEWNFDLLTAFIVLHIAAIGFYQFYKKQSLTKAMINGRKTTTAKEEVGFKFVSLWLALAILLACAAAVYALANCCADSIPSGEIYF